MNMDKEEIRKQNRSIMLGIIIIIIVIIASTGCAFYKSLNADDFKNQFAAIGYTIDKDQEAEYSDYKITSYQEASKEDMPFKVIYYEFENEIEAQKVYQKYKTNLANYLTTSSKNTETTGAVFTKMVATSEGEYIVISRIKNTLIFVPGLKDYKSTIDEMLVNIGY